MEIRENQRVALTKRLLQEGLFRLLKKKELSKISVTELCTESGINRATFYKHYGCPDDVLAAVKEQFFQDLLESQGNSGYAPVTYIEALGRIFSYIYEHKELAMHIINNLDFNISDLLEKMSQGQNGMYEYLEKNFDKDSAKLASTFIGYGAYSMTRQWLAEDIARTPKEMEDIIHKLLNDGLFQSI